MILTNQKQLSFFLLVALLPTMLSIGYSIREYIDTKDYIKLTISIGLVIIIIFIARFYSKIAFKKNTYKDLYNQVDID